MPTITSNGTGGGNWGTGSTWVGGVVPANNETVVIASGDTVIFNVDQSGFADGMDGMTINGTLKVSTSTSSYMKMKAATVIVGAGTFNIGEAGAGAIPFAVKFTLTGGAGWYIDGVNGLTMTVYGAEPTNKYIKLSENEAAGQTELSVDTNVTGDIWAAGDTIRIDNINKGADSEERVIAAGGIAAGAITVTAGITNAKITGALVILVTRNINIIAVGTMARTIYRVSNLTVASGQFTGVNKVMFESCTMNFSGGVINYCSTALLTVALTQSGGIITATTSYITRYVNFVSSTGGLASGCSNGLRESYGTIGALTISGCAYGIGDVGFYSMQYVAPLALNGTIINGCGTGVTNSGYASFTNVTITNCGTAFINSHKLTVDGGTFSGNTYHIRYCTGIGYNMTLTGGTENYRYDNQDQPYQLETFEIFKYGGNAGAYKSWTRGGVITSQTSVMPTGYSLAYLFALANTMYCFKRFNIVVPAGESVSIEVQLRKSASMTYLPRVYLMNMGQDPTVGTTPVDSFTMTNSTDTWESDTFTMDNSAGTTDLEYTLWFMGKSASGNMYAAYDITTATGAGGGAVKIMPLGRVGL